MLAGRQGQNLSVSVLYLLLICDSETYDKLEVYSNQANLCNEAMLTDIPNGP